VALYDHENFKKVYNYWKKNNPEILLDQLRKTGWHVGFHSNFTPLDYFILSNELPSSKLAVAQTLKGKYNQGKEIYEKTPIKTEDIVANTMVDKLFLKNVKKYIQKSNYNLRDFMVEKNILNKIYPYFDPKFITQGVRVFFPEKKWIAYDKINIKF